MGIQLTLLANVEAAAAAFTELPSLSAIAGAPLISASRPPAAGARHQADRSIPVPTARPAS